MRGRLASSLHRQQARIANRDPAFSRRAAAAEHALRHAHVIHDPLGHLSVTGNEHTLPVRLGCLAAVGHFVLVTSGGLQDKSTSKRQCRESGHKKLRGVSAALVVGERHDHRGPERLPHANTVGSAITELVAAELSAAWVSDPGSGQTLSGDVRGRCRRTGGGRALASAGPGWWPVQARPLPRARVGAWPGSPSWCAAGSWWMAPWPGCRGSWSP